MAATASFSRAWRAVEGARDGFACLCIPKGRIGPGDAPLLEISRRNTHKLITPVRSGERILSGVVSSRSEIHLIGFPEAGKAIAMPGVLTARRGRSSKACMMIAYFLLVHRYPAQFKRLFKAIYTPGNQYVVHVDKSSGPALALEISQFLEPYQAVEILEPEDALWGGYSLVDAELRGMARLLAMNGRWTHFINLSGQDFPLKSQDYIRQFFAANPGKQFIRALDQRKERPDTMNRVSHLFVEEDGKMTSTGVARAYLSGDTPFIGTQWKAVTRSFCEFVCHDPRVERFKTFYRHSFIADEAFFQTVIMNCGDQGIVMNDDLRMIDWVPDGDIKLRPRNFGKTDLGRLQRSPDLFARKFDAEDDTEILTLLERHLRTPGANIYRAPVNEPMPARRSYDRERLAVRKAEPAIPMFSH
jgi:hypothetical protein